MLGGTFIGSLAAFFSGESPFAAMIRIAHALKIWAIVAAIGGTFDAIENFQKGVLDGSTEQLIKQVCLVISAMVGVKAAVMLIQWLVNEELL